MKITIKSLLILLITLSLGAKTALAATAVPQSEQEKTLYALGLWLSKNVKQFQLNEEELHWVEAGLEDASTGKPPAVALEAYMPKLNDFAHSRLQIQADQNKKQGLDYVKKLSASEKGATTFPSGLVYIPMTKGKGRSPKATDTVKVNYEGKLLDGSIFDSSYKRNQPAEFPLNGVIPCWTEGVQKMKIGETARLICPSSIAYGDEGRPGIPPGATLDFKVELLEAKASPPAAAKPQIKMPAATATQTH
jgi:FKBP-type peptidyl-prolyl cis-trans isomerase FkpA